MRSLELNIDKTIATLYVSNAKDKYLGAGYLEAIRTAIQQINHSNASVVILKGSPEYFSAGASQASLTSINDVFAHYVSEIPRLLLSIKIPAIALMEGHAIGGGLALGLWCDHVFLAEESLYGANFQALGFTPGMGSTLALEEYFGKPLARRMIMTGELCKGRYLKALHCPIAYNIFPKKELANQCQNLATTLADIAPNSLQLLKKTLANRRLQQLEPALKEEEAMHKVLFSDPKTLTQIKQNYAASW